MSVKEISDAEFERQYRAVKNAKPRPELKAQSARYDRKTKALIVKLTNGSTIETPIELLEEFKNANPEDIAAVELTPQRNALHWEKLDQDFSVGGLVSTVFGQHRYMAELGRKGGSATTVAKAAAARENGRKGGRPRRRHLSLVSSSKQAFKSIPLQPEIEHLDTVVTRQSQMATDDLIRHDAGLTAACNLIDRKLQKAQADLIAHVLSGVSLASLKPSQKGDILWTWLEADDATLAPAA